MRVFFFIVNLICLNDRDLAIQDLIVLALFYMMRLCEYCDTPKKEQKKTKMIKLRDITFRVKGCEVPWNGDIDNASEVLITFRDQKNGERIETISASRTGKDLCPCRAAIRLVKRIRSYRNTDKYTRINVFSFKSKMYAVKNTDILKKLKAVVKVLGEIDLGLKPNDIGLHSFRASYALILSLMGASASKIMLLGRWKSKAFLKYIKR